MDTYRGNFGSTSYDAGQDDYDLGDDEASHDVPPASIGTDERRMQVRAYNHWASLLGERNFPSIEDLEPEELSDFGPYSVLLDFTSGIEDPALQYLGSELAVECGTDASISQLSDVPSRSLLSRITDHYMQIMANQAPIGFEAEFVNQRSATILYRGILLPYSSDGETIDFIYGVINWKEMADQATTDELLLEIDQALEADEPQADDHLGGPITDWADGPVAEEANFPEPEFGEETAAEEEDEAAVDASESNNDDFDDVDDADYDDVDDDDDDDDDYDDDDVDDDDYDDDDDDDVDDDDYDYDDDDDNDDDDDVDDDDYDDDDDVDEEVSEPVDPDDWVGYLGTAQDGDDFTGLSPENESPLPVDDDAPADEEAAASSFFNAIDSSTPLDEQDSDTEPVVIVEDATPDKKGGVFSAAAEEVPRAPASGIDWITVAYFAVAAVCFALVIYFYLTSS